LRRIGIIGGGVAGLSATFEAVEHGAEVTILEALPHLGGRAAAGKNWDTGRHLVSSSYYDFLQLTNHLRTTSALTLSPMALGIIEGRRKPFWYMNIPLLGNIAPLAGLITSGFIPLSHSLNALKSLMKIVGEYVTEPSDKELIGTGNSAISAADGLTISQYMDNSRWSELLQKRFGNPSAIGMCNLSPVEAAVEPFILAMKRIFHEPDKRAGWVHGDAGRLITNPAPDILAENGITVRLKTKVDEVRLGNLGWKVKFSGEWEDFDAVIITVPPSRLDFLDNCEQAEELVNAAKEISGCRIITIRASFDGIEALPGPIAEGSNPYPVWFAEPSPRGGVLLERVLSGMLGSYKPDINLLKEEFVSRAKDYFNATEVISEIQVRPYMNATPSIKPGTKRPKLKQSDNLYYAGDWSDTGLPPTLESAARAGRLAGKAAALKL